MLALITNIKMSSFAMCINRFVMHRCTIKHCQKKLYYKKAVLQKKNHYKVEWTFEWAFHIPIGKNEFRLNKINLKFNSIQANVRANIAVFLEQNCFQHFDILFFSQFFSYDSFLIS